LNIGILACSIPCLKPLAKAVLEKFGYVLKSASIRIMINGYIMQSSNGSRTHKASHDRKVAEVESEMEMGTFREKGVHTTRNLNPKVVSEEDLLSSHELGIVKTVQVGVSSNEERKSGVVGEVGGPLKNETRSN
jgi:hypothetical protein